MLALYQGISKTRLWAVTINDYRQLMTVAFSNNGQIIITHTNSNAAIIYIIYASSGGVAGSFAYP
jgi:hypothetical protein